MRDKSLAIVLALGMIGFAVMFRVSDGFSANPVASSDVTVRTGDPTVDDDVSLGFLPGFVWINSTTPQGFILMDATDGAAVWQAFDQLAAGTTFYGEIYEDDGSTNQVLDTQNVWEVIEQLDTAGLSSGTTLDIVTDNDITIDNAAIYLVQFDVSFQGSNSTEYEIAVFVNGSEQANVKTDRLIGTGTDVGSASASGLISLSATDTVDLRVRSVTSNNDNFTLENGSLSVVSQ